VRSHVLKFCTKWANIVRIKDGPSTDFNGNVEEVNYQKSRVACRSLFSAASYDPVELEFGQVEKPKSANQRPAQAQPSRDSNQATLISSQRSLVMADIDERALITQSIQEPIMAKKIIGFIKLQVAASKDKPYSPPIGPALGQRDALTSMEFCKAFNAADPRYGTGYANSQW